MRLAYLETLQTKAVAEAQQRAYGRARAVSPADASEPLSAEVRHFIEARDSFYLATLSDSGWPYVQHRGGPVGFLKAIGPRTLAFADFPGNRQLLSTGNLASSDRASLFLMDYVARERLKLIGHARVLEGAEAGAVVESHGLLHPGRWERVFLIEVVGYDWNCPQQITPRFTHEQVLAAVAPLQARIQELETMLARRA